LADEKHMCATCGRNEVGYEGGQCESCGTEAVKKAGKSEAVKKKLDALRRRQGNGKRP
jgi:ribosomal protein L37E